ncbi:MAG: hypothetical protein J7M26_04155, partial [Armatimonadetes bacterium]|nr:hypothetical protein [Armatimonadota bacterium]
MPDQVIQTGQPLKIYTVFTSSGIHSSSGSYPLYHPDQKVLSNEEILALLRQRLPEVEFLGDTQPRDASCVAANLAAQRETIDGVLYFGSPPDAAVKADLPTVAVFPLWGQWQYPFNPYHGSRIVTAFLPIIPDNSGEVFEARLDDVASKVRLIGAFRKLRGHRVLIVTDQPILGAYEPTSFQTGPDRAGWEQEYLRQVEEVFGASLVVIPQAELVAQMRAESEEEAQRVAAQWIEESEGIKQTTEEQVVASARLYLAMKTLMDKYDCGSITTEGYGVFHAYREGPIPCQGMPSSALCTEGIIATSETLVDSLVTQHLGHYITGFAGHNGDYVLDPPLGVAYIGHCECPFNPWGDERRVPYYLRQLPQMWERGKWEEGTGGACVEV